MGIPTTPAHVHINPEDSNKSHWGLLAEVLEYGPGKMKTFKALIEQSQIEMKTEYEQEKKRLLDSYLKKRIKGPSKQQFQELVKDLNENAEVVRAELAQL